MNVLDKNKLVGHESSIREANINDSWWNLRHVFHQLSADVSEQMELLNCKHGDGAISELEADQQDIDGLLDSLVLRYFVV